MDGYKRDMFVSKSPLLKSASCQEAREEEIGDTKLTNI
jgi:hypothetical protein